VFDEDWLGPINSSVEAPCSSEPLPAAGSTIAVDGVGEDCVGLLGSCVGLL